MKETKKILLTVIVISVFVLGWLAWQSYLRMQQNLSEGGSVAFFRSAEKEEAPEKILEVKLSQKFTSPANDLRIMYSEDWKKAESYGFSLEDLSTEHAETLFFGTKMETTEMKMAWLIIQKLNVEREKSLEEIVEEIKMAGEDEEEKTEIEIKNLVIKENSADFDIYQDHTDYLTRGQGKIVLTEENVYSIIAITSYADWGFFQKEAEKILNSSEVLLTE